MDSSRIYARLWTEAQTRTHHLLNQLVKDMTNKPVPLSPAICVGTVACKPATTAASCMEPPRKANNGHKHFPKDNKIRRTDGQTNKRRTDGRTDRQTDKRTENRQNQRRTDEQTIRRTNRRTDVRTGNAGTDRQEPSITSRKRHSC